MNILFLTCGDRVPSTRFRVLPYVPHLRALGHRCTVASSFPQKYDYFPVIGWRASQALKRMVRRWHLWQARWRKFDVVFLEREIFDNDTWSFEQRFRETAPGFVLDVDDGIFLRYPQKFEHLARMADVVIAGNEFLKDHIEPINPHVTVIPTCVDMDQYPLKQDTTPAGQRPVIGWMGTTGNLEYLRGIAPALRNLATRCDYELRLIAAERGTLDQIDLAGVNVRFIPWEGKTEVEQLLQFDIGIMPLDAVQQWNVYKCGLKLIQYMGLGIPGVASPIGVNAEIIRHGEDGFLASDPQEWEERLFELAQSPELRMKMGHAARPRIAKHYSIQAHILRLAEVLETAAHSRPSASEQSCP
jgi:glycosyltransferase involved in cell wall biosynthesis